MVRQQVEKVEQKQRQKILWYFSNLFKFFVTYTTLSFWSLHQCRNLLCTTWCILGCDTINSKKSVRIVVTFFRFTVVVEYWILSILLCDFLIQASRSVFNLYSNTFWTFSVFQLTFLKQNTFSTYNAYKKCILDNLGVFWALISYWLFCSNIFAMNNSFPFWYLTSISCFYHCIQAKNEVLK